MNSATITVKSTPELLRIAMDGFANVKDKELPFWGQMVALQIQTWRQGEVDIFGYKMNGTIKVLTDVISCFRDGAKISTGADRATV